MTRFFSWLFAAIFMCTAPFAAAQERGTANEAKALADKALEHVKAAGTAKAFEDFSAKDGKWQNKDLYVFVIANDGNTVAHGANKALVGKNLAEMKDPNGKLFIKEMLEVAKTKGTGWVDYMFTDPQTKKSGAKSSYVAKIPGFDGFLGVGIYK
jgi:signal transduction histidine kinase